MAIQDPQPDRVLSKADEGFSVREAAAELGVHAQTMYAWVRAGKVPISKFGPSGGIQRIHPDDLDDLRPAAHMRPGPDE